MTTSKYIVTMIILACSTLLQAKTYVVCTGIADYPGYAKDLRLCANDARTIAKLYTVRKDSEVKLLTDSMATVANVKATAKQMYDKAKDDDAIVFFFSGHGSPGSFACYDNHLYYSELTDIMSASKAKNKIVMADACYSGNARREKGKKDKEKEGSIMYLLSSRSTETSAEYSAYWENGIFTAFLSRGLRGGADADRDKIITARELFLFVNKGVARMTKERQHPVMWGRFDSNMPVMNWK